MSEMQVMRTQYNMKKRLGGWRSAPRYKLIQGRRHTCPGWLGHDHPRRSVVFRRHNGIKYRHGHLAYAMYWRLRAAAALAGDREQS